MEGQAHVEEEGLETEVEKGARVVQEDCEQTPPLWGNRDQTLPPRELCERAPKGSRNRAGSGAGSVGSRNGAGSGADSVGSRYGAGFGADSVGSRNGADSVGSRNGAGSAANSTLKVEALIFRARLK